MTEINKTCSLNGWPINLQLRKCMPSGPRSMQHSHSYCKSHPLKKDGSTQNCFCVDYAIVAMTQGTLNKDDLEIRGCHAVPVIVVDELNQDIYSGVISLIIINSISN